MRVVQTEIVVDSRLNLFTNWRIDVLSVKRSGERALPHLVLLHGLGGFQWQAIGVRQVLGRLARRTGPFVIVLPHLTRPLLDGIKWRWQGERAFFEEILPAVEARFPLLSGCRSLGGYGWGAHHAGRLAFHRPEVFASLSLHSFRPGVPPPDHSLFRRLYGEFEDVPERWIAHSPLPLAQAVPPEQRLPLWLDCGQQDALLPHVGALHAELDRLGWAHHFETPAGGHDVRYWRRQLPRAMDFHTQVWARRPD